MDFAMQGEQTFEIVPSGCIAEAPRRLDKGAQREWD